MIYYLKNKDVAMEGFIYPASLLLVAVMAFIFFQNHNTMLMVIAIGIGIYIVYSHETGNTATDFKNEILESIDEEAGYVSDKKGIKGYDPQRAIDSVEK